MKSAIIGLAAATAALAIAPTKQVLLSQDAPTPLFNKDTMPALSTTMYCIINLSTQYFVIYTALAAARTYTQLYGGIEGALRIIESTASTVGYAPMLCVLFLGTRMRAIQLAQGETERYGLPQGFVQDGMYIATIAVLAQVLFVLVIPFFTGEYHVPTDADGNVDVDALEKKMHPKIAIALNVVRFFTMLALYGGFTAVTYGVYTMPAPKEIWGEAGPAVSPAVAATINLTVQFFVISLGLAIVRTIIGLKGSSQALIKLEGSFQLAAYTVNLAPMLCILFIGARMRALQIDPQNGAPPAYAQNCFYLCAYSVMLQAVLVVVLPYINSNIVAKKTGIEGDVEFKGLTGHGATALTVVRYLAMVALYLGFTVVMYSIFNMTNSTDASLTPSVSPSMLCVMNLCAQYFTIYLVLFLANTYRQFFPGGSNLLVDMMDSARKTVMYAPMLCILFLGTRMRALQLTRASDGTIPAGAGPTLAAQEGMYLCTWAVLIQVVLVCVLSVLYHPIEMDEDGNVKAVKAANPIVGHCLNFLRYACMLAMYGGSMYVLYSCATMTPETLPPYAAQAGNPVVAVPAPPQPPATAEITDAVGVTF